MAEKKKRRRQRGEGSVFQRKDGMWIGQLDLGWIDGKRNRPTVSAKTQRAAVTKLNKLKDHVGKTGGKAPEKHLTVEKWLTTWVEDIKAPTAKPKTLTFYRNMIYVHLIPAIGKRRLDTLQTEHVRAMHKSVMGKQWRGKSVSATTAAHAHQTLYTALETARREGKIVLNVAALVDPPGRSKNDRGALTAAQARTLLLKAVDDRMSSRWMMALLTGARQGECLGLQWDRVDLDRSTLDLSWQLQIITFRHGCGDQDPDSEQWPCDRKRAGSCPNRQLDVPHDYEYTQLAGGACLVRPKSEAGTRLIPIVAPLHASLTARRTAHERERGGYITDLDLVWCRPDGRPIPPPTDTLAWRAACEAAGVPVVDLHAARHTASTLLLEAGVDIKVVQQIVGHSNAATSRAYQHVDLELARRALDALVNTMKLELPSR